jgi:hypothetical protein
MNIKEIIVLLITISFLLCLNTSCRPKDPEVLLEQERSDLAWRLRHIDERLEKLHKVIDLDSKISYKELLVLYREFIRLNPSFKGQIELPEHLDDVPKDSEEPKSTGEWLD